MIILAAAIILSLNSSGIIGKAKEATTKSDEANLKEAASIKLAEYELAKQLGELANPNQTAAQYVKEKLQGEMDVSGLAITSEGEILTGLTEIAVKFVEAGVEIGAEVTGYVLDNSEDAKTYPTSGNENTCDPDTYEETDPQKATLTRDNAITWRYFGIDEKGEATIVGSITSASPKMTLGGKGGYLNGPQELKDACEAMYSGTMGTGRSITIEDVTRVLEYTGERGSYYSAKSYDYTPTKEPLTIGEIISKYGEPALTSTEIPEEGKNINTYKANYYYINKTDDASEYNTAMQNLIYPGSTTDLTTYYWLASPCVNAYFDDDYASFSVRFVDSLDVRATCMFDSYGSSGYDTYAVRPVVSLSSDIQMTYSNGVVALSAN